MSHHRRSLPFTQNVGALAAWTGKRGWRLASTTVPAPCRDGQHSRIVSGYMSLSYLFSGSWAPSDRSESPESASHTARAIAYLTRRAASTQSAVHNRHHGSNGAHCRLRAPANAVADAPPPRTGDRVFLIDGAVRKVLGS